MIVIGALQQTPEEGFDSNDLEVLPAYFVSPDGPRGAIKLQAKIIDRYVMPATAENTEFPSRTSRTSGKEKTG